MQHLEIKEKPILYDWLLLSRLYSSVSQPFFVSRHPSLVMEQFGGTPGLILIVYTHQVQKLAAPLELFQGTHGCRGNLVKNHCSIVNDEIQ